VFDDTPPLITCPEDVTVECADDVPAPDPAGVTSTDNCGGSFVTFVGDVVSDSTCINRFTISRTYMAEDSCGNTAVCVQTIEVFDGLAPAVTCPASITINCEESTAPDSTGFATATDNCDDVPLVTFSDITVEGECANEYTITRTWFVTDSCGNSTACIQMITVQDTTPPIVDEECQTQVYDFNTSDGSSCPMESEVSIFGNIITGTPINANDEWTVGSNTIPGLEGCLTDNCTDPDSLLAYPVSLMVDGDSCNATYTVIFEISDGCGNTSPDQITYIININDDTPPVLTCPEDVTIECGDSTLPADTGIATATDDCNDATVTSSDFVCNNPIIGFSGAYNFSNWTIIIPPEGGSVFAMGNDEVMMVGPDDGPCEGGASVMFSIEILETGQLTFNWFYTTDDVDGPAFDPFGYNINGVFFQLTDDLGPNTQSGTAVVTVTAGDVFAFEQSATDCIFGPGATTIVEFFVCNEEPTCTLLVRRTWTAEDDCGNISECVQDIFVEDTTSPVITCPGDVTIECTDSTLPDSTGFATATDICVETPDISFSDVTIAGNCPQEYTIVRTWVASDACENTSTCNQIILVDDSTAPIITCPADVTIDCTASSSPDSTGFATATDNCGGPPDITSSDVTVAGTCAQEYGQPLMSVEIAAVASNQYSSRIQWRLLQHLYHRMSRLSAMKILIPC
jgi:hypothetical protein